VQWVNAEKPYKTAKEFVDAAKAANGTFKMGGTGSKQEDQIITEAVQKITGAKFIYIPQRGGGGMGEPAGGVGLQAALLDLEPPAQGVEDRRRIHRPQVNPVEAEPPLESLVRPPEASPRS